MADAPAPSAEEEVAPCSLMTSTSVLPPAEEESKPEKFSDMWERLKEEGWSYKKGTGLVAWLYCKPGCDSLKDAKKNADYFETETAVMCFVQGKPIEEEIAPQKRKRVATARMVMDEPDEEASPKKAKKKGKKAGPKKEKKNTGPKKAKTAYNLYTNSVRPGLVEEAKNAGQQHSPTEMTKTISDKWKSLPSGEKQPFMDQSKADKERYTNELAAFKEAHPELFVKEETPAKPENKSPMSRFTVKGAALPQAPFALSTISSSSPSKNKKAKAKGRKKPNKLIGMSLLEPYPALKENDEVQLKAVLSKLQGGNEKQLGDIHYYKSNVCVHMIFLYV